MEFLEQAFPHVEIAIAHGKVIMGFNEFALSSAIEGQPINHFINQLCDAL